MDGAVVHDAVSSLGLGPLESVQLGMTLAAGTFATSLVRVRLDETRFAGLTVDPAVVFLGQQSRGLRVVSRDSGYRCFGLYRGDYVPFATCPALGSLVHHCLESVVEFEGFGQFGQFFLVADICWAVDGVLLIFGGTGTFWIDLSAFWRLTRLGLDNVVAYGGSDTGCRGAMRFASGRAWGLWVSGRSGFNIGLIIQVEWYGELVWC